MNVRYVQLMVAKSTYVVEKPDETNNEESPPVILDNK